MSQYVKAIERIKEKLDESWLTYSQEIVWNRYLKLMDPPYYVVNIFGGSGSGKTFIGWLLEKKGNAKYVDVAELDWDKLNGEKRVVLDRYDVSRRSLRTLRAKLSELGISQALVLSRERARDDIPCLELLVTSDDINIAKANLFRELNIVVPEQNQKTIKECFSHLEN